MRKKRSRWVPWLLVGVLAGTIAAYFLLHQDVYVKNNNLRTLLQAWQGNRFIGMTFVNMPEVVGSSEKGRTWTDSLRTLVASNPQQAEKEADLFALEAVPVDSFWGSTDNIAVWLGQASFFVRVDGVTFLTDPNYAASIQKHPRLVDLPCSVEQLRGLDYILLSNNQPAHVGVNTLKDIWAANPQALTLAPLGMRAYLAGNAALVQEAGWFQEYTTYGQVRIYFLPARAWSGQGLFDRDRVLWGSFVIQTPRHTIFFAGSTGWGTHFEHIALLFPEIDYAFIPIGGYAPAQTRGKSALAPADLVRVNQVLRPKHIIPMSYGTYDLSQEPPGEPFRQLQELIIGDQISSQVHFLKVGELFPLP